MMLFVGQPWLYLVCKLYIGLVMIILIIICLHPNIQQYPQEVSDHLHILCICIKYTNDLEVCLTHIYDER